MTSCGLGWAWLPVGVILLMTGSIVITYAIAVLNGDVSALFPYISDTGAQLPESAIFAQFLNSAAAVAIITLVFRFWFIMDVTEEGIRSINRLAKVNLVLGVLAAFGLSLVGNFQDDKIPAVHFLGAGLTFVFGGIYCFIDSAITYKMSPQHNSWYLGHARLGVAFLGLFALIITTVAGGFSSVESRDAGDNVIYRKKWQPDEPGYTAHLVSTFGEWFMALAFILYFVTMVAEFRKINVHFRLTCDRPPDPDPTLPSPSPSMTNATKSEATENTRLVSSRR